MSEQTTRNRARAAIAQWIINRRGFVAPRPRDDANAILAALDAAGIRLAETNSNSDTTEQRAKEEMFHVLLIELGDEFPEGEGELGEIVGAQIAALDAAGIQLAGPSEVVVDTGRFERVAGDAERWRKFAVTGLTPDGDFSTVQPGDLDPIPAPDTREAGE